MLTVLYFNGMGYNKGKNIITLKMGVAVSMLFIL